MFGASIFFKGWQKTNMSMLGLSAERGGANLLEALYRRVSEAEGFELSEEDVLLIGSLKGCCGTAPDPDTVNY